jgi:hypothetical protein
MKKLLLVATCAASIAAYALPTYEPFTEYAALISASGSNAINLATGGYTVTNGPVVEQWGAPGSGVGLFFSGTSGTGQIGQDVVVTNNSATAFTGSALATLLPSGFPGVGSDIRITAFIPTNAFSTNYVGNSAVLKFSQDITRPTNGIKTIYVSYLLDITLQAGTGSGNNGRYCGFLASTNLYEGPGTTGYYQTWASLFNTFGTSASSPKYVSYGLKVSSPTIPGGGVDILPDDSSAGNSPSTGLVNVGTTYNTAAFVVGEFTFTTGGSIKDTNTVWVNPPINTFSGLTPSTSNVLSFTMGAVMSDVGGFFLEDRQAQNTTGGCGPLFIGNLLIGSTWSYVTGGPEFTNQPSASTSVNLGQNVSLTGLATAAGQTVSYQWVIISGGQTNPVSGANISGTNSSTLNIAGFTANNVGNYQLVATASGTGYSLNSTTAALALADPQITASPANTTANYHQSAGFTGTVTTASAPLTYRWYDGANALNNGTQPDGSYATGASGTTGAGTSFTLTLTLTNVSYQDIGNYKLYVTNNSSLENSSAPATLTVNDPYVVTPPANPGVTNGRNATFTVVASGSTTLNYQWYENGIQLNNNGTTVTGSATVSGATGPTLTLTGVQDADNGSYYCTITSTASGQSINSPAATLTVQDPLTIISTPISLAERVGDHLAFTVGVTGGGPSYQWYAPNGGPIAGATTSALVLTNIQTSSSGTYSVVVSNLATAPQTFYPTLTVINSAVLTLWPTNLVVARVGDGAQTLSGATGNTLYLDQYTPAGTYVNSIQVPDEGTGQAYGTGSSNGLTNGPALLVEGAGADAGYEAMLTLSGVNQEYIGFVGYCAAYPFFGTDVTVGGTTYPNPYPRGLATINAFGIYSLAYTNCAICSGGNHTIRDMVTLDGTNFWITGQSGAGTVKYANSTDASYAGGNGLPGSSGDSAAGGRTIQIVNGPLYGFSSVSNLVFTDAAGPSGIGLYAASGTPEPGIGGSVGFTPLLVTGGSQPGDFAFSPDNQTIYVADSGLFTTSSDSSGGGIQRWDTNSDSGGWTYSYTLPVLPGAAATNGAQGLTVDFTTSGNPSWGSGVHGAVLYATTAEPSGNRLIKIVDNGAGSSATLLAGAGPSQMLAGVRFGPVVVPPGFSGQLQPESALGGSTVTFSAGALGSGPLTYQWYFQAGGVGAFNAILHATNATYTISAARSANVGNYYVIVTNPGGLTAQSPTVSLTLLPPPQFTSFVYLGPGLGFQLNFTGPAGYSGTIWTSADVRLSPVESTWTALTTGTFSGGTDTYTDPNGGTNPQQFYIISVP